jgi:adenylate cyclase 1
LLTDELCRCILWDLSRSFLLRLAITIFSIILIYTMAQVNVVSATFPTVHNVK